MENKSKRELAYIYLLHRMFKGDVLSFRLTMRINDLTEETIREWDKEYSERVKSIISGEDEQARSNGQECKETPTIKSIKEKTLIRINGLVNLTDDPARLAQVYKTLSEFESTDDKKEKGVVDAVRENVKPLAEKDKETPVTMLDVLRSEGKAPMPVPGKRRPGRPRKNVSQNVNTTEE